MFLSKMKKGNYHSNSQKWFFLILFQMPFLSSIDNFLYSQSLTYYLDYSNGNDLNNGLNPQLAWKTFTNVNAKTFQPGDSILLKSGEKWVEQFMPKGSGSAGNPIVVEKYGGNVKPIIDGNGVISKGAVYLVNQEYWEINNIEITNNSTTSGDRRGVHVAAYNGGLLNHIYLRNLRVHNVKGIVGQSDAAKRTGGIGIEVLTDDVVPTRFNDILIEGCEIDSVENTGLFTDNPSGRSNYPQTTDWLKRRFTNVIIRNNVIHHVAKNAMIIRLFDKGVIEHNVCYETALQVTGNTMYTASCDGTVFQYNEGYFNRSPDTDGSMYDADLRSPNTVWQYSYSHDNNHGLMWFWTDPADSGIIVRYNISQNDKGYLIAFRNDFKSAYVYNNIFYVDSSRSSTIIHELSGQSQKYFYHNNIIYNNSSTSKYTFGSAVRKIDYNVFYGKHPLSEPNDMHKMLLDPKFVNPGGGLIGINTLDGYKLQSTSPCINSGTRLLNHSNKDFWGNLVPEASGLVDRGAHEFDSTTGIEDLDIPQNKDFRISQNFPNPFNPETRISFELFETQFLELTIFNLHGEKVKTLISQIISPGKHETKWDGKDDHDQNVTTGVYFGSLRSNTINRTIKMVLIR